MLGRRTPPRDRAFVEAALRGTCSACDQTFNFFLPTLVDDAIDEPGWFHQPSGSGGTAR